MTHNLTVRFPSQVWSKVENFRRKSNPIPTQNNAVVSLVETGVKLGAVLTLQELSEAYERYQSSDDPEALDRFERLCEKVL